METVNNNLSVSREEFNGLKAAFEEFMKGQTKSPKEEVKEKEPKKKKEPSVYNNFISAEYKKIKEKNPDMNSKQVFKTAVENWNKSKPAPTASTSVSTAVSK